MKLVPSIEDLVTKFFNEVKTDRIEIYNEISLQLEFGIYLRSRLQGVKIGLERNAKNIGLQENKFSKPVKKKIDIAITSTDSEKYLCAIELKYPRNGQVPETMYSFCKDIAFLEQLVKLGFRSAYFIAVADHHYFHSEMGKKDAIYKFFRTNEPITGKIHKPTGTITVKETTFVIIDGRYHVKWLSITDKIKYLLIQVGD